MFFKKKNKQVKTAQTPYPYNTNVPFEVAFKALKEGYLIKVANNSEVYMIMINNKIIEIIARENGDNSSYEINEFDVFTMLIDGWQIIEPNSQNNIKKRTI